MDCQIRVEHSANKGLWERGSRADGGAAVEAQRRKKSEGEGKEGGKKVLADSLIP